MGDLDCPQTTPELSPWVETQRDPSILPLELASSSEWFDSCWSNRSGVRAVLGLRADAETILPPVANALRSVYTLRECMEILQLA